MIKIKTLMNIMHIKTRRGKIARLPLAIRQELNTRLHNGEEGKKLLVWLNALPAVQEVLAAQFKGKPVAPCNLSEWKQGGFVDWLLLEHSTPETRAGAVMEMSPDLIAAVQGGFTDKMAVLLAARMMAELRSHPLSSNAEGEAKLWRELRLGLSCLKRCEYITQKARREEAKENGKKPRRRRLTEADKAREAQIILGINPDGDRFNQKTQQFEGPNAVALNEQRLKVLAEDAVFGKQREEERCRLWAEQARQLEATQNGQTVPTQNDRG